MFDTDVRQWFKQRQVPAPTVAPDLIAQAMAVPHPGKSSEARLCWLGGVPRWSGGMLQVSSATGEMYARLAPRWLADNLARCHPASWDKPTPPRAGDFASIDWAEALRPRGLVQI